MAGTVGAIALRSWADRALVKFSIGVTKLNRNITLLFPQVTDGVCAGDSKHEGRLTVSNMTNSANVDSRLAGDDLRVEWGEFR